MAYETGVVLDRHVEAGFREESCVSPTAAHRGPLGSDS